MIYSLCATLLICDPTSNRARYDTFCKVIITTDYNELDVGKFILRFKRSYFKLTETRKTSFNKTMFDCRKRSVLIEIYSGTVQLKRSKLNKKVK